jgi:hypothetical protein
VANRQPSHAFCSHAFLFYFGIPLSLKRLMEENALPPTVLLQRHPNIFIQPLINKQPTTATKTIN